MLLTFLRHVRRQSKTVRNNYALALAGVFTALVALVWLQGAMNFGSDETVANAEKERNLPFSNLIKQTKEQWAGVKMALKEQTSGTSTEPTVDQGEALPDSRTLILTDETINDQSAKLDSPIDMGTTTESNQSVEGMIEVQIATSTATTTTSQSGGRTSQ